MTFARVVLKSRRAKPFFARHPWVFAGAIADVHGEPADGDVVDLFSTADTFIARGLYNSQSKIQLLRGGIGSRSITPIAASNSTKSPLRPASR